MPLCPAFVRLDLVALEVGQLLQLAFHGLKSVVEGGHVILLRLAPLLLALADDRSATGYIRLDHNGDWQSFPASLSAVRHSGGLLR